MKVTRAYLNKYVNVTWRDPCSANFTSHLKDGSDIPKGRAVLAFQEERGVVEDITEGVIRICHTRGIDSSLVGEPTVQGYYTWVVEELIEKITIYEPATEPKEP